MLFEIVEMLNAEVDQRLPRFRQHYNQCIASITSDLNLERKLCLFIRQPDSFENKANRKADNTDVLRDIF